MEPQSLLTRSRRASAIAGHSIDGGYFRALAQQEQAPSPQWHENPVYLAIALCIVIVLFLGWTFSGR
jgi:hypothetical protein